MPKKVVNKTFLGGGDIDDYAGGGCQQLNAVGPDAGALHADGELAGGSRFGRIHRNKCDFNGAIVELWSRLKTFSSPSLTL